MLLAEMRIGFAPCAGLNTSTTPSRTSTWIGAASIRRTVKLVPTTRTLVSPAVTTKGRALFLATSNSASPCTSSTAAHRVGIIDLNFGRGVEGDDRAVLERHDLGFALAGDEAAAMAQQLPGAAGPDQRRGGNGAARPARHAGGGRNGGAWVKRSGVEVRTQRPRPFAGERQRPHAAERAQSSARRRPARPGTAASCFGRRAGRDRCRAAQSAASASIWCAVFAAITRGRSYFS